MLVPNQLVEVRVGVKTLKHYKELGYDVKCFDTILVPPEHCVCSGHLLPTEQELFDAIDYLVNTEHHFKEIILSDWKGKEEEECQKQ